MPCGSIGCGCAPAGLQYRGVVGGMGWGQGTYKEGEAICAVQVSESALVITRRGRATIQHIHALICADHDVVEPILVDVPRPADSVLVP